MAGLGENMEAVGILRIVWVDAIWLFFFGQKRDRPSKDSIWAIGVTGEYLQVGSYLRGGIGI